MAAIDIGAGAIIGTGTIGGGSTWVDTSNPCNGTGTISSMSLYFSSTGGYARCGTFSRRDTTYFTLRDEEYLGFVNGGSKQTFTGLSCDVSANDYMGIYLTNLDEENIADLYYNDGDGVRYVGGNKFTGSEETFTFSLNRLLSMEGSGTGTIPSTGKKWNGITISKRNGVVMTKINGV